MFGRIVSALLAIVAVKIITSYIGVAGYGMYTTVYEFVGLFAIVGDMGLYTIAVREMSAKEFVEDKNVNSKSEKINSKQIQNSKFKIQNKTGESSYLSLNNHIQKIYSNILTMRAVLTTIVMLLVGVGGMFIPAYADTPIVFGIWICAVAVWLNLFQSIITSILQHHLKMHLATIALIAGKILSVAIIIFAAVFINHQTLGFYIMVAAGIVGHGLMLVFAWFYASRFIKVKFAFDKEYCLQLIKKAWPYGLALILSTIYFKIDVTLLSLMRSQEEVGFYGVPLRMVEVLIVLPLFFMNSVIGTMTKAVDGAKCKVRSGKLKVESLKSSVTLSVSKCAGDFGEDNGSKSIQKIFSLSLQFLLTAALPIFIFVYFFGREIIGLISSESFLSTAESYGSDSVLILLVIALCLSFFSTLCSFTMVAFNQQKRVLWVNAGGALFNLFTNLYFIPLYGFMGAAMTSIASEILILILAMYFLLKTFRFSFQWGLIFKTLLTGLVTFFSLKYLLFFLSPLPSLLQMLIAGIVMSALYLGILYFTKTIDVKGIKSY